MSDWTDGATFTLVVIVIIFLFATNPLMHFWKSPYQQKLDWCKLNKPTMNITTNERISNWCYGSVWNEYCKKIYPDYCP